MSGFTDYHAHFVYGVDDGAQTREEMYAMLDAAAADGVRHLFATSHSTPGME
ncbi:MAG TPA: protein tyrosine phosphatase, partial [Faecalibacterium sp.]|nr:protein tyrosine phosphatase [Faecalibacterium sp.]